MKRMEPENQHGNWMTPPHVLDLVRQIDRIGLDPCAAQNEKFWFAETNWNGKPHDGLAKEWPNAEGILIYVNPPYGSALKAWAVKMAGEAQRGCEIVSLLPARTDPEWMQDWLAPNYDAMCFLSNRIAFLDPLTGKPAMAPDKKGKLRVVNGQFPSVVVYFGDRAKRFCRVFGPHGFIIRPTNR